MDDAYAVSSSIAAAFAPILKALADHRAALLADERVFAVRPGFDDGEPPGAAILLSVRPGTSFDTSSLMQQVGQRVRAVEATPEEQLRRGVERGQMSELERFLRGTEVSFAPPRRGSYEPPDNVPLETVRDVMDVEISASPDVGWTVLRDFLAKGAKKSLTVGIYQFTAPHVYKALRRALLDAPKATLAMCRQPKSERIAESGNKADDLDGDVIVQRLHRALGSRFEFVRASTGAGNAFATSYHIKVAVADQRRFWLSSGNWQSSNQSPFDPLGEPDSLPPSYDSSYNREYHAVVEHPGLAKLFETYLDHDRTLAGVSPFATVEPEGPSLVLPDDGAPSFAAVERFPPLRLQEETLTVTPVLTPDNYAAVVQPLLASAKTSIDLQNQYINLNAAGDFPEFRRLVKTLLAKGEAGVRIRIILRDYMAPEKVDMLLSLGFQASWFKFMKSCHAKLIVVDDERALLGSHNWSNEGTVSNRDASLLFDDERVARYLGTIFEHDWAHRARTRKAVRQPRVAEDGESFTRSVPWESLYEPLRRPVVGAAPAPNSVARDPGLVSFGAPGDGTAGDGSDASEIVPFGIDGTTGERLHAPLTIDALRERIERAGAAPSAVEAALERPMEAFDLPIGTDPNDLRTAGWAVLWGSKTSAAVRAALKPLVDLRRSQMPARFFKEIEAVPGESVADLLRRHNVTFGAMAPHRLPYHVLVVASPDDVSFEVQYGLDLEYSVGRLWFDDENGEVRPPAFGAYAAAVVAYENGRAGARPKRVCYWGPKHQGDGATALSSAHLLHPLFDGEPDDVPIAELVGAEADAFLDAAATRSRLLDLLGPQGPSVLFTAGHGMGFPKEDAAKQRQLQGALLTADWTGFGSIQRQHYLAAADVPVATGGLVAFLFACFGAGTPRINSYPDDRGLGIEVAASPFVSALAQRLLEGGTLGVIGHIDLAWGYSIRPLDAGSAQRAPFAQTIGSVLASDRVGHATRYLNGRAQRLAAELAELLRPGAPPPDPDQLARRWLERNDARAYLLLGDPAARLTWTP